MLPIATSWLSGATDRILYDAKDESLATAVHNDVVVSYVARQLKHFISAVKFQQSSATSTANVCVCVCVCVCVSVYVSK